MVQDTVWKLLCKHCPTEPPKSNLRYGGFNLKQMLESRKGAFIPGRRSKVVVNQPSLYFKLPWFRKWLNNSRCKRSTRGYSATAHTIHHTAFKNKTSSLFAKLVKKQRVKSSIFVLDDFDQSQRRLRTVHHLSAMNISKTRLCVANPGFPQYQEALRAGCQTSNKKLEHALDNEWKNVQSSAAYLDTCSGSHHYISELIEKVLLKANKRYILAFTLLGRGCRRFSCPDEDLSITSRLAKLDRVLRRHGFSKYGKDDEEATFVYSGKSMVVTVLYQR